MRPIFGQSAIRQRDTCRIDLVGGALAITSPYDAGFIAGLKATVAASDRKWDSKSKRWLVSFDYGSRVQRLIKQHYGETVSLPDLHSAPQSNEMRLLDVRYIGAAKTREDGQETSYGWSAGQWSVIFPKSVLLEWFGQTSRPGESHTLYGVLGVSQSVAPAELKTAWRRMARTWHPDLSKEPGSAEQFRAIQQAYEVLGDKVQRARYDAGLKFEGLTKAHSTARDRFAASLHVALNDYRAPLRCGLILAEGQSRLGRFVVSKIIQWADIVNIHGEILVTSWGAKDDHFTESWVMP